MAMAPLTRPRISAFGAEKECVESGRTGAASPHLPACVERRQGLNKSLHYLVDKADIGRIERASQIAEAHRELPEFPRSHVIDELSRRGLVLVADRVRHRRPAMAPGIAAQIPKPRPLPGLAGVHHLVAEPLEIAADHHEQHHNRQQSGGRGGREHEAQSLHSLRNATNPGLRQTAPAYSLGSEMDSLLADLAASIAASPIAFTVTDPRLSDNPAVLANAAFAALTGYDQEAIAGRNLRLLQGQETNVETVAAVRAAIAEARPISVVMANYRRDGAPFMNAMTVSPLRDVDGRLAYFLGSQVGVGISAAEQALAARRDRALALVAALPARQRQVLTELAAGARNKDIAFALGVAEKTVKMHRSRLLANLGAGTTAEAIRIAVEAGL
jgi:PAS domain S-box-containing protein